MSVAASAARPSSDVRPHAHPVATERRAEPRFRFLGEVAIGSDSGFFVASAVDVTSRGVRIASRRPLRIGSRVSLQIVLPGDAVLARGVVRFARSSTGGTSEIGIELDVLGEVDRRVLEKFLRARVAP